VDMIGSRLLFDAYGAGRSGKPLAAGLLGQHSLIALDEAHLSPAFAALILQIAERTAADERPMRVMRLSATQEAPDAALRLTDADLRHPVAAKRLNAPKSVYIIESDDLTKAVTEKALSYKDSGVEVVVFVRTVADAQKVYGAISKKTAKS